MKFLIIISLFVFSCHIGISDSQDIEIINNNKIIECINIGCDYMSTDSLEYELIECVCSNKI